MEIDFHELRNLLQNHVLRILFVKKDGTEREMYCTLLPETIANTFSSDRMNKPPTNQTRVIPVFDTQIQGWRSVIVENIISYNVVS